MGGKPAGANRIEAAARGCVLIENWTAANGVEGISFNHYDPATGRWHQRWTAPGGVIAWTPSADGSVRQVWRSSKDGGKTWTVAFDGHYRREGDAAPGRAAP